MTTSEMGSLFLTLLIVSTLAATDAEATIVPVSQERTLEANASASDSDEFDSASDSDEAIGFGLYDEVISVEANVSHAFGAAFASQRSEIGQVSLAARGSALGDGLGFPPDFGGGSGDGTSHFEVVFTLTEAASYVIQGRLIVTGFGDSVASVQLRDDTGIIVERQTEPPFDTDIDLEYSGTLRPGQYTVEAVAFGEGFGNTSVQETGTAFYDVLFLLTDFGPGGEVPDGDDVWPGAPVRLRRSSPLADVELSWGLSCRPDDVDYAVYGGLTPNPADFEPVACTTGGLRDLFISPASPYTFFLVVPHDGAAEGSYGDDGSGAERSPSALACYPQILADPVCPR